MTALLLLIMLAGGALRATGLDWDEGVLLHPDERFLTWVAADLQTVDSLRAYFDTTTSTMNPNNVGPPHSFFVYGTLPVFLGHFAGELTGNTSLWSLYMPGRMLTVGADVLTILFAFLAARRLFDWRAGLLAATLYAFAALPVQLSHFYTVDPFTQVFAAAAFWFAARALFQHNWLDYPLFGLMLGLAMASKLSIAPLALVLVLAVGIRTARRLLSEGTPERDVQPLATRAAAGLVIAGVVTVLVFRVAQPYAFLPPGSGVPLEPETLGTGMTIISRIGEPFGFRPNPDWLRQIHEVQVQVSGGSDIPPNHQWGQRLPLVFPWVNMVRVGLGWPLGLFAWFAFAWALWEIARRSPNWWRLALPVTWTALFFLWQGTAWVKTMRYFLPIYPALMMLAGWALVALWDRVSGLVAERRAPRWHWSRVGALALTGAVVLSALGWSYAVTRIYTRTHTRIAASRWVVENIPGDVTLLLETEDGARQVQVGLRNDWPPLDPAAAADPARPSLQYSYLPAGDTRSVPLEVPFDGTLVGIRFNHVMDPLQLGEAHRLSASVVDTTSGEARPVAEGALERTFRADADPRGQSYMLDVEPTPVQAGGFYRLDLRADGSGPLVLAGATIATEGMWDDPVPLLVPGYDVWGSLYQPLEFNMAWEDLPEKRLRMQYILDNADYLTISSNRFYDSLRRNPARWPMTLAYYEALFSGELGFELLADFTSPPTLGPITFNDLGAEEAWTVYDHPRVMVFRKTAAYDPARTAAVLNSVDIEAAEHYLIARDTEARPVELPIPEPRPYQDPVARGAASAAGQPAVDRAGTATAWNLFAGAQPLGVVVWWLAITVIGWLAFPALWALLPGLPDRGYPLARTFGLLFGAWLAWLLASTGLATWSRGTILLSLLVMGAGSLALVWPRRAAFAAWVRDNRRHILRVEAGMAALFLLFVLIRLGNPDLWHPAKGGEKPMDFAYLNAVLRSDSFPPYDPWFAGETINYYYFGFVIAGLPIKLLGVPPAIGYNLVLPALFALTGAAAFSAAYNLTAPLDPRLDTPGWKPYVAGWQPYAAGLAALLLAVLLGNLDQVRTVLWGLAELGQGGPAWAFDLLPPLSDVLRGLSQVLREGARLPVGLDEWYWNATRLIPVPLGPDGVPAEVQPITEFPFFTFLYADLHAHLIAMPLTLSALGWAIASVRGAALRREDGQPAARRWLHAALLGFLGALVVGALRPTNTWDYPTYLVIAAAAVVIATFVRRGMEEALPAVALAGVGALLLGGLFFALGASLPVAGAGAGLGLLLGFALGLGVARPGGSPVTYWSALGQAGALAGLLALGTLLLFLPFIQNYRLGYSALVPWTGSKTALWAVLDMFGLFLFIIATWLAVDLWGWLSGRITRRHTVALVLGLAALAGVTALAASAISPVAAVALPLLVAALALFIRPGQPPGTRLALTLLMAALSLLLLVEMAVLEGDLGRMNTVFKFTLQVWLLLAVVAGTATARLIPSLRRAPDAVRVLWLAVLAVLVGLAAAYPLTATQAKVADRWNPDAPRTLDGMAYMPTVQRAENGAVFSLEEDYDALRWLQQNARGNPVIMEGLTTEYLWGSRVSVYTGLPAVVGWNWHQRQQRPWEASAVVQRISHVNEAYNTPDVARAAQLLDEYGVDLVFVGGLERAVYDPAGLAKFQQMADAGLLRVVYERGDTVIYEVLQERVAGS